MGGRLILSPPTGRRALLILMALGVAVVTMASIGSFLLAYSLAGYGGSEALIMALATVLLSIALSPVNIPVAEYRVRAVIPVVRRFEFLWFSIEIPEIVYRLTRTVVAVNAGGCLIPLATATSLVARASLREPLVLPVALASALMTSLLVHPISRVIRGIGVVVPGFYPPAVAAISAVTVSGMAGIMVYAPLIAFASGVYGTLIGADLMNLRKMVRMGVPLISIGGMGTFDGIYLSGVVSVSLALLLAG